MALLSGQCITPAEIQKEHTERECAERIALHKLRILHLRSYVPNEEEEKPVELTQKGGITVAYRVVGFPKNGRAFIEVSQAICSPRDHYDRKVGRRVAVEMFHDGHYTLMQMPRDYVKSRKGGDNAEQFLIRMLRSQL